MLRARRLLIVTGLRSPASLVQTPFMASQLGYDFGAVPLGLCTAPFARSTAFRLRSFVKPDGPDARGIWAEWGACKRMKALGDLSTCGTKLVYWYSARSARSWYLLTVGFRVPSYWYIRKFRTCKSDEG